MSDSPWYAPVGKFMLAFGDIEHSTISLLSHLPESNLPVTAPKLALGVRIDLLREVLPRNTAPEYQEVLTCLDLVSKFTSRRNLVAHNAVWFDIYHDGERILITDHLVSARDESKRLTLAELEAVAGEVYSLAARLNNAVVAVLKIHADEYFER